MAIGAYRTARNHARFLFPGIKGSSIFFRNRWTGTITTPWSFQLASERGYGAVATHQSSFEPKGVLYKVLAVRHCCSRAAARGSVALGPLVRPACSTCAVPVHAFDKANESGEADVITLLPPPHWHMKRV